MHALTLLGCTTPLIEERVVEADVHATWSMGGENDLFGDSVAWREGQLLVAAPGRGCAYLDGEALGTPADWVGWISADRVQAGRDGRVEVDGEARWQAGALAFFAVGERGAVGSTVDTLWTDDAGAVASPGIQNVGVGEDRRLAVVCDSACGARAFDDSGADVGEVAPAGHLGAVAEWRGVAWAGDPQWEDDDGAGRVCSEDGVCVEGLPGDHLGVSIGGGYAAGVFNKWVVPPRARVVPLVDGAVYAFERGVETRPLALSGDGSTLVIGSPWYPVDGRASGAVAVVTR